MLVVIVIHHLESVELFGHLFDLVLFARLFLFDAWGVPFDIVRHDKFIERLFCKRKKERKGVDSVCVQHAKNRS